MKRINTFIDNLKGLDRKSLESIKYLLIFAVIADMIGIYWYFELKKLGMALMLVILGFLTVILILERRKSSNNQSKMENKKSKEEVKKDNNEKVQPWKQKALKKKKKKKMNEEQDHEEEEQETQESSGFGIDFEPPDMDIGLNEKDFRDAIGF